MVSQAGKTILITGAASGLGRQLALDCAGQQVHLVLFDRQSDRLGETAEDCRERGATTAIVTGDVTNRTECRRFVDTAMSSSPKIDYLIVNAGVSMWAKFEEVQDLDVFEKVMAVNYLGGVYCTYYALPHLKASRGMIVGICSIQGRIGVPYHTGYVASKHALHGFFSSLRHELHGTGVDILEVFPHWITGTNLRRNAFGKEGTVVGESTRKHTSESLSVDSISRSIIEAMGKRRRELFLPSKLRGLLWLNEISPRLAEYIVGRKVSGQK